MPKKIKKNIDFKKAFTELEEITTWFENDNADLENGIKKYERALELSDLIRQRLQEAELEIKRIQSKL